MHLKREEAPKNWPIPRKGSKYLVRPNFHLNDGIPILILLRDMLKVVKNKKEAKKVLHLKQILLNNKIARDEKNTVLLFDTLSLIPSNKHYRINLSENGKFITEEISEKEINFKISKINNKKILKGKKIQLNFLDGRNIISNIKCNMNDSALINLKDKKIVKCIPLENGSKAIIFKGKHSGEKGVIEKIFSERKIVELNVNGKKISVLIKQLMVFE